MAGRFNGTSGSHRALRHAGGASMPGPGNTTFVYSVYVDSLPNTYHTILGFQYNQASFSDTRYKFTSIGPWGAGSAQNFAYSDGVDTLPERQRSVSGIGRHLGSRRLVRITSRHSGQTW